MAVNSQSNLEKQSKAGDLMIPDFKLYYKAVVIKTVWYGTGNKNRLAQNRTE